ncbi:hypothetical protein P4233_15380 [Pseudomonas aeruginosa]|nr:hypothetical protein [Pseudomonas aeruginosa]
MTGVFAAHNADRLLDLLPSTPSRGRVAAGDPAASRSTVRRRENNSRTQVGVSRAPWRLYPGKASLRRRDVHFPPRRHLHPSLLASSLLTWRCQPGQGARLDLPAAPLGQAINALAQQSSVQILSPAISVPAARRPR